MDLSVIIVSYKTPDLLKKNLAALLSHTRPLKAEVIVVDNDSSDGSSQIAGAFEGVQVVESGANLGFAGGVNRGLKVARGRYALILNPDIEMRPGSLEALIRFMDEHPKAGLAGPKLLNIDGTLQHSCRRFYTLKTILLRRTFLKKLFPKARALRDHLMLDYDHQEPRAVDWLAGAAMIARRVAVRDVGAMDDRYFLYFEDVDWCRRMHARGWDVYYVPQSVMIHEWQHASSGLSATTGIHIRSGLRFYERWGVLAYVLHWYRKPLRVAGLVLGDAIAIVAAFLMAYWARQELAFLLKKPIWPLSFYVSFLTTSLAVFLLTFVSCGLYRQLRQGDWIDVAFDVMKGATLALLIVMASTFMLDLRGFSRVLILGSWPLVMVLAFLNRRLLFATIQKVRKERLTLQRYAVLGDDPYLHSRVEEIENKPGSEFEFVRLGIKETEPLLQTLSVERVVGVIVSPQAFGTAERMEATIQPLRRAGFEVCVAAPFLDALPPRVSLQKDSGIAWLTLIKPDLPPEGFSKRILDLGLAFVLTVLCFIPAAMARFSGRFGWYSRLGRVIRGSMSLVGPRPMTAPDKTPGDEAWARVRSTYRPGITGLWSIEPCSTSREEAQQELEYLEEWSVETDLKILVRVFVKRFLGRGRPPGETPMKQFAGMLAVFIVLSCVSITSAQPTYEDVTPFLNAYNLKEIVLGGDGNLWIASNGGALRFNPISKEWKTYPRMRAGGPPGNDCVTVSKGGDGLLWFGSAGSGVSSFDLLQSRWSFFEEVPSLEVRVVRALGSQLFIGTQAGLSLRFQANRTDVCNDINVSCIVPSYVVNDYAKTGDSLWVATQEGLGLFDGSAWVDLSDLPQGSRVETVSLAVYGDRLWVLGPRVYRLDGGILLDMGASGQKLKVCQDKLYLIRSPEVLEWDGAAWASLGSVPLPSGAVEIRDIERVGDRFYVTTDRGLAEWAPATQSGLTHLPPGPAVAGSHTGLAADSEGTMWVGNREGLMSYRNESWSFLRRGEGGLNPEWTSEVLVIDNQLVVAHCCCNREPRCKTDFGDGMEFEGIDVYDIASLATDGNYVWGGNDEDGAFVFENVAGTWEVVKQVTTTNSPLLSNIVPSVAASKNEAWFGHSSQGISYWRHSGDLEGGVWSSITTFTGLWDNSVNVLYRDGTTLWAGTSTGIHRIQGDVVLEGLRTVFSDIPGDRPRAVRAIVVDEADNLWLGTDDGVLILERGRFEFRHLTTANSSLPSNDVLSGALNPVDGSIWFGCEEGLVRIDPRRVLGVKASGPAFAVYPNPFDPHRGSVTLVDVSSGSPMVPSFDPNTPVDVLDISGNVVNSFRYNSGWTWDGFNLSGQPIVPGLYIVRVRAADAEVVLLKLGVVR